MEESPQGSLFAKTFYLDAVGAAYKIGVLEKGSTLQGGIVLAKNEINAYSNPMFVKYLGVLLRSVDGNYVHRLSKGKEIVEKLVENVSSFKSFDYTFHPSFENWLPFYWIGYRQETRYTYRINNLSDMQEVEKNTQPRIRNDIRKAVRNEIQITNDISLEEFYHVCGLTYRRQGGPPPYSFQFLRKLHTELNSRGAIKLFAAKDKDGHCHAVSGIVCDKNVCYLIFNGVDPKVPNCGANTLLIIKTIEYASKIVEIFDFEGSMIKPIERFYRAFGGILTPYYNIWDPSFRTRAKRLAIKYYKKLRWH